MDRSLAKISRMSEGGALFPNAEIETIESSITTCSASLSEHIGKMRENVVDLVRMIEKTKYESDKRALRHRIWHWLSLALKVLTGIFTIGAAISPFIPPLTVAGSAILGVAASLTGAAAKLCNDLATRKSS